MNKIIKAPALYNTILIVILALAVWVRIPTIDEGLPFFYREDEAHHFNRTVNMVKEGELNPRYFHKPSLHFYLRMPFVVAGFLDAVKKGHIRSIKEIKTYDKYGLARYAFTASHPGIVKWNRALSVVFSLLIVLLSFLITRKLSSSPYTALLVALLVAVSPDLIKHSATVGVDALMAMMCLAAVYFTQRCYEGFSYKRLLIAGLFAGLAVSSKYNALPVACLPLAVCLLRRKFDITELGLAIFSPVIGFFLGSPYILSSLPLFLDHLAYEVWHYGVAGHEGHTATPGLPQALFYLNWLASSAIGIVALLMAGVGVIELARQNRRLSYLSFLFPLLFALLMITQKANFTRNMLVIIPFIAILSALGFEMIARFLWRQKIVGKAILVLGLFFILYQPLNLAKAQYQEIISLHDTRLVADKWLKENALPGTETAIAGQLLFPPASYQRKDFGLFDQVESSPLEVYLAGYDRLVYGNYDALPKNTLSFLEQEKIFSGVKGKQRIVKDPQVEVYSFKTDNAFKAALKELVINSESYRVVLKPTDINDGLTDKPIKCESIFPNHKNYETEDSCWMASRRAVLDYEMLLPFLRKVAKSKSEATLKLELMTPWAGQRIEFVSPAQKVNSFDFATTAPGKWTSLELSLPLDVSEADAKFFLSLTKLHSPYNQGLNKDKRRLGVAIKPLSVN